MVMAAGPATDPAQSLLDRKMKLAEHLSCKETLKEADSLTTALVDAMRRESDLRLSLSQAKRELDDAEATAEINAPGGSNESERKKAKMLAIKDDQTCKQAAMVVSNRERDLAVASMDVEAIKRQLKVTEMTVDYRIAALRMLGS